MTKEITLARRNQIMTYLEDLTDHELRSIANYDEVVFAALYDLQLGDIEENTLTAQLCMKLLDTHLTNMGAV